MVCRSRGTTPWKSSSNTENGTTIKPLSSVTYNVTSSRDYNAYSCPRIKQKCTFVYRPQGQSVYRFPPDGVTLNFWGFCQMEHKRLTQSFGIMFFPEASKKLVPAWLEFHQRAIPMHSESVSHRGKTNKKKENISDIYDRCRFIFLHQDILTNCTLKEFCFVDTSAFNYLRLWCVSIGLNAIVMTS